MCTLHEDLRTHIKTSRLILLRLRNISDKILEEIKTHITTDTNFISIKIENLQ